MTKTKAALVVGHPGHELRVYGWMAATQPVVHVITDGSGHGGASRVHSTNAVLHGVGAAPGSIYGRMTDREIYAAMLDGDHDRFITLAEELAEDVARLGSVIIRTLQGLGIAACGKHFPGHGDTSTDSHFELPLIDHPRERFDEVELVPFKAAIAAGVASIMTAHILIPALDEEHPATLSRAVVDGLLKKQLGYEGLVLSDDLEMKAVSGRYGHEDATIRAIEAGCDAVLMCAPNPAEQVAALEAIIHAVEEGRLPLKRAEDALARHRRVKARFLAPPRPKPASGAALRAVLGRDEHLAVAAEMARFA